MADQIDINERLLTRAIKKLDLRIAVLTSVLKTRSGRLTSDAINLRRAISMRTAVAREFGVYYDAAETVTDYRPVLKDVGKVLKDAGISKAITKGDVSLITAFSDDAFSEMSGVGQQYAAQISERIYTGVVTGDLLEDMTQDISQMLVGGTDKAGRPMASHSKTIATTRYMEVDSVILRKKSDEAGITKFKYAGSLIKDSRKWCVDHVNKTYTLEEIDNWESQKWQGKKSGDPFVVRGGWNCRHRWLPVVRKEAKGKTKKRQNFNLTKNRESTK
jgi:hypothetical protein